jgi:hypothetical protein
MWLSWKLKPIPDATTKSTAYGQCISTCFYSTRRVMMVRALNMYKGNIINTKAWIQNPGKNTRCQYSKTNEVHFLFSVHYDLTASTCFEHYVLIFRRRCINNIIHMQYTNCLCSASWRWETSARNMQRLLINNKLNTERASRWSYYTEILWCTDNKTLNTRCILLTQTRNDPSWF